MSENSLFVYGSLLSPEVLKMVIGRVAESKAAMLNDYACYYVEGATFPAIIKEDGAQTLGKIMEGLSEREIIALDRYEDTFYKRLPVQVHCDGSEKEVMAYILPEAFRHLLSSRAWSWEEFQRLHMSDYIERMRGV